MSILEVSSRNIGREYTYDDVSTLVSLIESHAALPESVELYVGSLLAVIALLDVASGRVASSADAQRLASGFLHEPMTYLPG